MESMDALVTSITGFITAAVGWMGQIADFITGEPLTLLLVVTVPLAGFGIGALRRLIG